MGGSLHQIDLHSTSHETHDADVVHAPVHPDADGGWQEPKNLDAPPPRPGYVQRWIRLDDRGGKDGLNFNNKMREGWRPRALETVPEKYRDFPTLKHSSLGDVIYVGGLVLCEMSVQQAKSRNGQVRHRINRQNRAVETDADETSRVGVRRGMAPIVREEELSESGGRRPVIQD